MDPDRQTVAVLLGAGASKDAGIPTTVEMTEAVIARMQNPLHMRALEFIHYMLVADVAAKAPEEDSFGAWTLEPVRRSRVDVERLFASVELLIDRHNQAWSPFVAAWSPGLDSFSSGPRLRERDLSWQLHAFERELDRVFASLVPDSRGRVRQSFGALTSRDASRALARGIVTALDRARPTDVSNLLRDIRGEMLRSLFDILSFDGPSRVRYLTPLARLARRQRSLTVGTLNYDRTVEVACRQAEVRCDTGIETWLKGGELTWSETGVRLLKLHGSIDWVLDERTREPDQLPFQRIAKLDKAAPTEPDARPAVVFGEAGKIRSEGPYLELLLAFATELKEAETLLVVGYSFRDQHVNEIVARWLSADPMRRMVVVEPGELDVGPYDSFARRVAALRQRRSGDEVLPGRVLHILKKTRDGLPEAVRAASSGSAFPLFHES